MYHPGQIPAMAARRFAQLHHIMYFEGGACSSGHTRRYTVNSQCVECMIFAAKVRYWLSRIVTASGEVD